MLRILLLSLALLLGSSVSSVQADDLPALSEAKLTPRVLKLVRVNYVAPENIEVAAMFKGGLEEIQGTVPEILAQIEGDAVNMTIGQAQRRFSLGRMNDFDALWDKLREIFSFIDLNYHGDTERSEIEYLAIDGMLKTLDPHSSLFRPKEYREFKIGTKGNFGGIGTVIGIRDGRLTVISPIDGTPADRAGLKAKDRIVQIGEDSTANMSLNEAVEQLRGPIGTTVQLSVERDNHPNFSVTLKRAIIRIDSVQSTTIEDGARTLGYLKVKSFQENTMSDLRSQLTTLLRTARGGAKRDPDGGGGGLDGLILDLRNNPGGLLQQAVEMADLFLPGGTIVSTVGANNNAIERYEAEAEGDDLRLPMIVLVNEGSASASEIVAGALQGHRRALVIGAPTFGKGSVQTVYDMQDGSALKLTIAEYLTSGRQSIQEVGVIPDIELRPLLVDAKRMNLVEDKTYGERDLDKHLKRHAAPAPEPTARLRYVEPASETGPDAEERKEFSNRLDLKGDYTIEFAKRLFAEATPTPHAPTEGPSGRVTLAWGDFATLIRHSQTIEEQKLGGQLAATGINWDLGPTGGKPQLQITYQLRRGGRPVSAAPVGTESELILTAKNVGNGTFHRLIGQTEADVSVLNNKEFAFGRLVPGEQRSWHVAFQPDKALLTEQIPVTVQFSEANGEVPASFQALVPIEGLPRPQFAYSYRLGAATDSKVRPQETLPTGKVLPLTVQIKNVGTGASQETVVAIKGVNGKGPFIETGRAKLGALAPGATTTTTLRFRVDPQFGAGTFQLDLAVTDTTLLETLTSRLEFTVGSGRIDPPAGPWYQAPTITLADGAATSTTRGSSQVVKGNVRDDEQVKDLYVFVGEQKVFYQANPREGALLDLLATLPLKVGNNLVTVAARDNHNLTARRTWTIYRHGSAETAKK